MMTLALALVLSAGPSVSAGAVDHREAVSARLASPSVRIADSPSDVVEGDRFKVQVKVGSPRRAKTVRIEVATGKDYAGRTIWDRVAKRKVRGKSVTGLSLIAGEINPLRLRAVVTYTDGRQARSKAMRVTNWRWFALSGFSAYYSTPGTYSNPYRSLLINGTAYTGWSVGSGSAWESRHTPGRNCRAFRGVVGVEDKSQDGSAAEVTLLADETSVVYRSPSLTPGAAYPIEVPLARPYRFSVQARITSTSYAYPAIGAPELLCDYDSGSYPN